MAIDFPNAPNNDDKALINNGALYTYDQPDDSWTAYAAPGTVPTDPNPSQISSAPAFESGTGTEGDPFVITTATVSGVDLATKSAQVVTLTGASPLDSVKFYSLSDVSGSAPKFTQATWIVDQAGKWTGQLTYDDALGIDTTVNTTYTGTIRLGNSVWFQWTVNQQV